MAELVAFDWLTIVDATYLQHGYGDRYATLNNDEFDIYVHGMVR